MPCKLLLSDATMILLQKSVPRLEAVPHFARLKFIINNHIYLCNMIAVIIR
jgi:hypothetical protein